MTSPALTRTYSYLAGANGGTTALVSGVTYSGYSSAAYTYSYDVRGNITAVYKNGTLQASYVYDDLNQLTRENNVTAGKTWVYTYDRRGNILSRKTYAYTTGTLGTVQDTDTYEYFDQSSTSAWGDILLRYDGIDYNIYDAIGNPTRYMNVNESGAIYTFSWQNGRQLASGTKGETSFSYTYNADGLRTKKIVDGVTTEYYWAGSLLAMMVVNPGTSSEKVLKFYYDAAGSPFCFDIDGEIYFYITNLQGDIVAIANQYGEGARYEYDAWGKILSISCATGSFEAAACANPLRYRGYIYDDETGFYYLQSRYYDPTVGRFINADAYVSTGAGVLGYNMYAYCNNNPVVYADESGEGILSMIFSISLLVGGVLGFVLSPFAELCSNINDADLSGELYTSEKHIEKRGDNFEERVGWYDVNAGATNDNLGYVEASMGVIRGEYDWEYFEIEFGMGKVSGEVSTDILNGAGFSAMAELLYGGVYFVIPVFDHEMVIGASGKIGGVGMEAKIGEEIKLGLVVGIGGTINVGFR